MGQSLCFLTAAWLAAQGAPNSSQSSLVPVSYTCTSCGKSQATVPSPAYNTIVQTSGTYTSSCDTCNSGYSTGSCTTGYCNTGCSSGYSNCHSCCLSRFHECLRNFRLRCVSPAPYYLIPRCGCGFNPGGSCNSCAPSCTTGYCEPACGTSCSTYNSCSVPSCGSCFLRMPACKLGCHGGSCSSGACAPSCGCTTTIPASAPSSGSCGSPGHGSSTPSPVISSPYNTVVPPPADAPITRIPSQAQIGEPPLANIAHVPAEISDPFRSSGVPVVDLKPVSRNIATIEFQAPEEASLSPELNARVSYAEDYSWVKGQLRKIGEQWLVVYTADEKNDLFGGRFLLAPQGPMPRCNDGDMVSVRGQVVAGRENPDSPATYRAASIEVLRR